MATLNLGRIKPVFRGAYAGGTAYVIDDIVTHGNESFICIQAGTGNATSNASYWTKLAAKGTDGTDVGTTITTQGDVLYRDGSGLQRLAKPASDMFLKNTSGGVLSWAEAGGKFESALLHITSGTQATTTTSSWTKMNLDTVRTNEITGASLSSGVVSLPAGTYFSMSTSQAYRNDGYNHRLRNTTDGADLIMGSGGHTWSSPHDASSPASHMNGRFTLSGTKDIEMQYYIETSNNQTTIQSGHPNQLLLWKIA